MNIGWGWFKGCIGDNHPHAHHALQIAVSKSPVPIWTPTTGWGAHCGFIVGSNQPHQLAAFSGMALLIYVEPDSRPGRLIQARLDGNPMAALLQDECDLLSTTASAHTTHEFNVFIESSLAGTMVSKVLHPSDELMSRAVAAIQESAEGIVQVHELARHAELSVSRFQHRFKEHTGMALRPFLRWRRLLHAMANLQSGSTLADAAYSAGFSDAAHMSRTMRRHFGISPRQLLSLLAG